MPINTCCPICERDGAERTQPGDGVHINISCLSCGPYVLTGHSVVSMLELERQDNILDQEPKGRGRVRASYAIRIRTSDNNPFKIDGYSLNEIGSQELPNPALMAKTYAEQVNLWLMYAKGTSVAQDDAKAVKLAAEQGLSEAQFNIGNEYANGTGVPQDDAEAVRWYRLAADQGNASAQYNLGLSYGQGRGVPQDDAEAVRWYRRAAEQGDAYAQHGLGLMYGQGRGVPQDDAEAVRWHRRAAEQGNAYAQHGLGLMYGQGRGVPQDDVTAHMWLNLAASRSTGEQREDAAKARDAVAERLTPEGRSEAQRLARDWNAAHPQEP